MAATRAEELPARRITPQSCPIVPGAATRQGVRSLAGGRVDPRRRRDVAQGARAAAADPSPARRADRCRSCAAASSSSAATGSGTATPTTSWQALSAACARASELIAECDVIALPKPLHADVAALRPGQVLWGWPHCVQDAELTQVAIDRRLTMIAWEAMNHWTRDGDVQPARLPQEQRARRLLLRPARAPAARHSGHYGPGLRAAVISFGATARGAVAAPARPRRPRHHRAHPSQRPGGRRAHAAGAARALRPRPRAPGRPRARPSRARLRSPSSWPGTTSSSTASSRTRTIRSSS